MASARNQSSSLTRQNTFIYKLPFSVTREICLSLDVDKAWEKLASEIGYTLQEVKMFELAYMHYNGSPTKELLTDWGSRNPSASDLYFKLQKIQRRREMQILEAWFSSTSNNSECNKIPIPKRDNLCESYDISDIDTRDLPKPKPPGRNHSSMTSSTNASMSSMNDNINFNKVEKEKSRSKVIDEKDISCFVDKKSVSKNFNCHSIKSGQPEPSIHEEECRVSSLGEGKGDMAKQPTMDNNFYERLKSHDGYSSLNKEGSCDIDVAIALMGTQSFTNKELNQATNGFSDKCKLGEGAFGVVYYGVIKKTQCAIKRLNGDADCNDDNHSCHAHLKSEIKVLIRYRHENIVPLYGYALDGTEICLVYQFMPNGSLEDRLQCRGGTPPLTWEQRLSILKGAACGLQYLHTLNEKPLIHGDIKSSNVLLDKYMEAKIGDLGLAQSITGGTITGAKTHITKKEAHSKVYQCKAYFPPESNRGSKMSIKGDAFSFGVVMYEVCTGEKAFDEKREGSDACFLANYIHDTLEKNRDKCLDFMDPRGDNCPREIFKTVFRIADHCTEKLKKNRPDMVKVFEELETIENDYRQKCGIKSSGHVIPSCGLSGLGHLSSFTSSGQDIAGTASASHKLIMYNDAMESGKQDPESLKTLDNPAKCIPPGQEPEAVMLQKWYDEGVRYPPNTPDTAEINDYRNPLYCQSDPNKIAEIKRYEAEFKFKKKEPQEMSGNFKSIEKEYEVADDGSKILPVNEPTMECDRRKIEEIEKFDTENVSDRIDKEQSKSISVGKKEGDSSVESDDLLSQDMSVDKAKQICAIQATSAEENEKLKQKRDDLFAKFEEVVQQGGVEDYDDTDEYDDQFSFFGSEFDTVRFGNDCVSDELQNEDKNCVETDEDFSESASSFHNDSLLCENKTETDATDHVINSNEHSENVKVDTSELNMKVKYMTVSEHRPEEGEESAMAFIVDHNGKEVSGSGCTKSGEDAKETYAAKCEHELQGEGAEETYATECEHELQGEGAEETYATECENKLLESQNVNCKGFYNQSVTSKLNNDHMNNIDSHNPNMWKYQKSEPSENYEKFV